MRVRHYLAVFVVLGALVSLRCGGGGVGAHPSGHVSAPTEHRAAAPAACAAAEPMPQCTSGGECANDSDCTNGPNGRCLSTPCRCQYNDCVTDADCAAGSDCACSIGGGAGSGGNEPTKCLASNCRTDGDCGVGGFCSPTFRGSACGSLYGWFCHTANDECGVDADCVNDNPQGVMVPRCDYAPERGIWVCATAPLCAG